MAMIKQPSDPRLVEIQLLMDAAGRSASFTELDPFGERHGSWQRTIHVWSDGLDRYVVAAVTNSDDGDEIAVMAGAEERVATDPLIRPKFRRFDVGTVRLGLRDTANLTELFTQAVRMALDIQPLQLEEMQLLAS